MMIYVHDAARHRSAHPRSGEPDLPPLTPGTSWVRFGRETLLYNDDDEKYGVAAGRASRGARFPRRQVNATRDQLHVVVQHGRLFEQQHPDVPVLHDRGRFLLVQLDPARARRLQSEAETCYGILPVEADQIVFEEREQLETRAPAPAIEALTARLTRSSVEATLKTLASSGSRHATSAGHEAAVRFAKEQFEAMGYTVSMQDVAVGSGRSRNVIASKARPHSPLTRVVIVAAHLDSINLAGGPTAAAPGADDNASGSAGVLEIARVLQDHPSPHDLRFILFGAEELGLLGSRHYVSTLAAAERSKIAAVVNMDMVGSLNSPSRGVLLEGAAVSSGLIDGLSDAAANYTGLTVETSLHPFASDHVPFIQKGIPAVLTIESADNTNHTIHSAQDTIDRIDYELLLDILRMNVAFIAGPIS
jgi:hypothetical protein